MSRPGIVFGVDERYLQPLLVTLTSIATSGGVNGDVARVGVLHTDLSPEAVDRLTAVAQRLDLDLTITRAEPGSDRFPVTDWISPAAYLRLQLADALPSCERLVYLDCDLVAVAPLDELLQHVPDRPLAAVLDTTNPTLGEGDAVPGFEALGLDAAQEYFNSGVMVIDVAAWVDERLAERCVATLIEHREHIKYWDQDALNIELGGDGWGRLDPTFNTIVVSAYQDAVRSSGDADRIAAVERGTALEASARILHFAGPFKPWRDGYPPSPVRDRYTSYADRLAALEADSSSPLISQAPST